MRKSFSAFAVKVFISAFALFVLTLSSVHAAGLGKLTVLSSLGQPLRAEIELNSVVDEEAGTIVVKLASVDAYRQANLEYNSVLQSLRFVVEKRGSRHLVRVSSAQSLNEPFVGMLLELRSSTGRLMREYTFLLDPAELRSSTSAITAVPAHTSTPAPHHEKKSAAQAVSSDKSAKPVKETKAARAAAAKAKEEEKAAAREERAAAKAAEREEKAAAKAAEKIADKVEAKAKDKTADEKKGGAEYKIKKGDKLSTIVKKHQPEEVSLEQMLVATYRTNPQAFIGNNMNRLRVGRVLTMPDADAAASVAKPEARKVIVAQAADFANYRNKLAEQVAQAGAQQPDAAGQAAGGKITAKVQEKSTAAKEAQDKLKLSKANAAAGAADKAAAGAASAEDKAAKDKAAADEKARVKELEKNVSDLQGILELKQKQMAEQQKQAAAKAEAPAPAPAVAPPAASVPAASAPVVASVPAKPAVKKMVPPPPPPESSFIDDLLDDPIMLGGIALAVLLLVFLAVRSRRKKEPTPSVAGSMVAESRDSPNSLFGSSGGQSVDTNNSIFNSGFTPSASLLDANEVDPVAEADVYIAYGREAQAIEILKEALRSHPERNALRIKLLEIYASQKDVNAFDLLAGELYGLTRGEGEEWVYAAGLGIVIDPTNPLYAGGDMSEELLERPTSLQGSMTQPTPEHDPEVLLQTPRKQEDELVFHETVQPTRQQIESPDLPLDLAEPVAPPAEKAPLDFDLTPNAATTVMAAAPQESPKSEASAGLASLNFDMGEFSTNKETPLSAAGVSVNEVSAVDFDQMLEFKPTPPAQPSQPETTPDEIEAQLAAADRELSSVGKVEPFVPVSENTLNTPVQPETAKPAAAAPVDFDFGLINLDLQPSAAGAVSQKPKPSSVRSSSVEMDTKIELAAAYLGIGDKEGARELLEEVIQEGAPEQIEKAKEALAQIS